MQPATGPPSHRHQQAGAALALGIAQIAFATYPVLGKLALRELTPFLLSGCRVVLGAALLSYAARLVEPDEPVLTRQDRKELLLLSILGVAGNQTFYILGLARTTASDVALLVCTIPIFTLAIAILLGRERASRRRIAGIPIALVGVLLLLNLHSLNFHDATMVGNLFVVVNCFLYSGYLVLARGILRRHNPLHITAAVFRYAVVPMLLLALLDLPRFHPERYHATTYLALLGIVLLPTILSYTLNAWALTHIDASAAAIYTYLQPLLTWTMAWLLLGERPGGRFLVAAPLILTGVSLSSWPDRHR